MKQADPHKRPTRHRDLTREEIDLWRQVTQTVAPFAGRRIPNMEDMVNEASAPQVAVTSPAKQRPTLPPYIPPPQQPSQRGLTPLSPLERRLKQRLSRGRVEVDAVMDLHGLYQAQAHSALRNFLFQAQASGAKIVLIITGKGKTTARDELAESGILRRAVPQWLRAPELRGVVVGFEEAVHHHGGAGALYVRIRRHDRPQKRGET
jgi:DNA-nicking Smr family endonuclease